MLFVTRFINHSLSSTFICVIAQLKHFYDSEQVTLNFQFVEDTTLIRSVYLIRGETKARTPRLSVPAFRATPGKDPFSAHINWE